MTSARTPSASGSNDAAETGPISLAAEFAPSTWDQWLRTAAAALQRDFGPDDDAAAVVSRLDTTTYDGIVIEPLYTAAHHADVGPLGFPGSAPLVRGRRATGNRDGGWDVRQRVVAGLEEFTAVEELERGATSVWLDLTELDVLDKAAVMDALDGVLLDLAAVVADAGDRWPAAAEALIEIWRDLPDPGAASGGFGADPVGALASDGGSDATDALTTAVDVVRRVSGQFPNVRVFTIDGTRYHDAGATDAQELAFTVAAALATVRAMADAGVALDTAFGQIELRLAASADQFATIAKCRAARLLWSRIAAGCGQVESAASTPLHAVTSRSMMSRHDPWVNLLRGATACFGAGVGGADSITVLPYDAALGGHGSELGRRVARNTQSILAKESNLARVIDPGGGAWYIESLTADLAGAAWALFQGLERQGGIVTAIADGSLAAAIDQAWQARRENLVTRRDPLTGVSEFPNIAEPVPPPRPPTATGASGLPVHRLAEPFEALRDRVDATVVAGSPRPSVFLANLGSAADFTARATFAKNLFEVAGVATTAGPGAVDLAELVAQLDASGATIACVCSNDRTYAELGVAAAQALRDHGVDALYLAGRPRDVVDDLRAAGVDVFVTAGADIEEILADLLTRLQVA